MGDSVRAKVTQGASRLGDWLGSGFSVKIDLWRYELELRFSRFILLLLFLAGVSAILQV